MTATFAQLRHLVGGDATSDSTNIRWGGGLLNPGYDVYIEMLARSVVGCIFFLPVTRTGGAEPLCYIPQQNYLPGCRGSVGHGQRANCRHMAVCDGGWLCQPVYHRIVFPFPPAGRYNMKLCLFVGVDSENKTTIFAQGLLANEQIPSFEFAIDHLIAICGGHPKVGSYSCAAIVFEIPLYCF